MEAADASATLAAFHPTSYRIPGDINLHSEVFQADISQISDILGFYAA
jgi:hypothetical protein